MIFCRKIIFHRNSIFGTFSSERGETPEIKFSQIDAKKCFPFCVCFVVGHFFVALFDTNVLFLISDQISFRKILVLMIVHNLNRRFEQKSKFLRSYFGR